MINIALLIAMLLTALWTVIGRSLLRAAISLASTSAIIAILMFRLDSPLAGVFELSVGAGLITVIFVSTISLTKPLTKKDVIRLSKVRIKRFGFLPLILGVIAVIISNVDITKGVRLPDAPKELYDVRTILWNLRALDLFGQIVIIIAGALAVVVLFEERKKDEW